MQSPAKFLGYVRAWKQDDQWRWCEVGEWAPEGAVIAKRLRVEGEDVLYVDRGGSGEFIRGAVKVE